MRAALDGDDRAFTTLVDRHAPACLRFAKRMLGEMADAEDAAQETFLRAHRRVGAFRGDAPLRSWLLRICRNHCLDRIRARPSVTVVALDEEPTAGADDTTASGVARTIDRERLVTAIVALPEALQQAVVLRELRGLSYEEVAGVLDVPVGTVRSRLSSGRALLRDALGGRP